MGDDCSKPYDPSVEQHKSLQANKLINWTKIPIYNSFIRVDEFGRSDRTNYRQWNTINTRDSNWVVFPSHFYHKGWKRSVSRYGTHVVGMESKRALATGVIAKPETWKFQRFTMLDITRPICPQGYHGVSDYIRYQRGSEPNQVEDYKNHERNIHCLKNEYMMEQGKAKEKYGINHVSIVTVRDRYYNNGDYYTSNNYMTIPHLFAYKGTFATLDLGYTADTLFPSPHGLDPVKDKKLVDFANDHFYFYGTLKTYQEAEAHFN